MVKKSKLTAQRLCELLNYSPETGQFEWRPSARRGPKKSPAGCLRSDGYVQIRVDGSVYAAHRLAWLYCYGQWPNTEVDHKNCNPSDNRIGNLRLATRSQNKANCNRPANNTSGYKGVSWSKKDKRWRAHIRVNYKKIWLGYYNTPEAAHAAYAKAAEWYFGKFARKA